MKFKKSINSALLLPAIATLIAGCGRGTDAPAPKATPSTAKASAQVVAAAAAAPTKSQLAAEIADTLQACSYDGSPIDVAAKSFSDASANDGARVVADIMKFTGLPQNFDVVEGKVPNAAAVIVMGKDKLPRRVIAYNKDFMAQVRQATQNNNWAPISIMAHEIGHHLSGHTIMPGGSQPPTELEADKFSGFVLYKMGAARADAQKAIETLVPETQSKTHPGRSTRVSAIQQGWNQACAQQSRDCNGAATSASSATKTAALSPERSAVPPGYSATVASSVTPATPPSVAKPLQQAEKLTVASAGPNISAAGKIDVLPVPSDTDIPTKFDQFVFDELGILDQSVKTRLSKDMYEYANKNNIEIVTLIVKDLHGKTADQYAYHMMRQLRVGKLEVGNGAVLVIAPNQNDVGVALGAGLHQEIDDDRIAKLIKSPLRGFMENAKRGPTGAAGWSGRVADASDYIRRDTKNWEWVTRYQSIDEMLKVADAEKEANKSVKGRVDLSKSLVWKKIVRVKGVVTSLDGPKEYKESEKMKQGLVDRTPKGGRAVEFKTDSGKILIVYVDKYTEAMMPTKLAQGKPFVFTVREKFLPNMTFDLLSYDSGS